MVKIIAIILLVVCAISFQQLLAQPPMPPAIIITNSAHVKRAINYSPKYAQQVASLGMPLVTQPPVQYYKVTFDIFAGHYDGTNGDLCEIDYSTNLSVWFPLGYLQMTGQIYHCTNITANPHQFYRVSLLP